MAKKARGYTVNGVRKALAVNVGGVMKIAAHDDCCCGCASCCGINVIYATFSGILDCTGGDGVDCSSYNGTFTCTQYDCDNPVDSCHWDYNDGKIQVRVTRGKISGVWYWYAFIYFIGSGFCFDCYTNRLSETTECEPPSGTMNNGTACSKPPPFPPDKGYSGSVILSLTP